MLLSIEVSAKNTALNQNQKLAVIGEASCWHRMKPKAKGKKSSPGQMRLPWDNWEVNNEEIEKIAEQFILANCYNPQFVGGVVLQNSS